MWKTGPFSKTCITSSKQFFKFSENAQFIKSTYICDAISNLNLKRFSKKLNVQLIAETFKSFGIEHIVLSPGSRNGALSTHFTHHPDFQTYSIVDERSAGFVALGMAQQLRKPVVVCCTSGSALVNYYPAVTEAFYQ